MWRNLNRSRSYKTFFFVNEEFFRFLLLSLAVAKYTQFFHMLQTLKLSSINRKTKFRKIDSWSGIMTLLHDMFLTLDVKTHFSIFLFYCFALTLCIALSGKNRIWHEWQKSVLMESILYNSKYCKITEKVTFL